MDLQRRDQLQEREADQCGVWRASDSPMAKPDACGDLAPAHPDDTGPAGLLHTLRPLCDEPDVVGTELAPDSMGTSKVLSADLWLGLRPSPAYLQEAAASLPSLVERLHGLISVSKRFYDAADLSSRKWCTFQKFRRVEDGTRLVPNGIGDT